MIQKKNIVLNFRFWFTCFSLLLLSTYGFCVNMETVFEDLAKNLAPSTVSIKAEGETEVSAGSSSIFGDLDFFFSPFGNPKKEIRKTISSGTGFVISSDGYIMTNAHVVQGANKVTVVFNNGKEYNGKVLIDSLTDLALVKIEADNLVPLSFADSDKISVGQWVVAIGNPLGFENTITVGVVSGLSREFNVDDSQGGGTFYPDAIQTDASINPGNSGGPLVDLTGKVIGINAAIASPSGGSIGIGFAVPSNTASFVIERLMKDGKVTRGYMGFSPANLTAYQKERLGVASGVYVQSVSSDSPAGKAGIKVEDVITSYDGKKVSTAVELRRAIQASKPDKEVKIILVRKKQNITVTAKVGLLPSPDENKILTSSIDIGMSVTAITDQMREKLNIPADMTTGVLIKGLTRDGYADRSGIKLGDILMELDGVEMKDPTDFKKAVEQLKKDSHITAIVWRENTTLALEISL